MSQESLVSIRGLHATAGETPSTASTWGFSIRSRNCLAYVDRDSTYRR